MRRLGIWGAVLTAVALAGCATPSNKDDGKSGAAAYFAADYTCKTADSSTVDLGTLTSTPERLEGRCVNILGFAKGNILYRDADHAAEQRTETSRWIGLDWNDATLARHLSLGPSYVKLTGRVRLCSRRKAMEALAAPAQPETGCRGAVAALLVSAAEVIPTSMD